ncbi:hypothetical protein XENOCAPTIV_026024 [Xenoophorus captivus]|uniref:Uncharacterized protein n=1 Tax=Xenoophorus captivus TaxID=1517983 RepID=A0ABV0R6D6_9TELE
MTSRGKSSQGSQFSRGPVLMLEELVEALQDRRRRVDQAFRLQLQQAEVLLSALQDQNVLNLNLQSGSTSDHTVDPGSEGSSEPNMLRPACTLDLQSKSWSEQRPINQPEGMEDVNLEHGSRLQESGKEPDVKPDFWLDLNSQSRDLKSGSKSDEIKDVQADLKHGSRSDPLSKSRSTEARNHGLGSRSDLKLIPASEKTKNLMANFRSGETTETRSEAEVVSLKSALQGQSRSGSEKARNLLPESSLDESTDLQTGLWLDLKTEPATKDSESNFRSGPKNQSRSELLRSGSKEGKDDLNCVSELLVSCTQLDLGSELQTSRLLERFKEAEPHFRYTVKSWESLREVHACLEEVKTGAVMNEDLLELLKIQQTVKDKIQRSELILNLSSSFHLTAKQNWAGFQVEQLEVRLGSLDSLCESWLNKAAQCEEELRREQLTHLLHEDITQVRLQHRAGPGPLCSDLKVCQNVTREQNYETEIKHFELKSV